MKEETIIHPIINESNIDKLNTDILKENENIKIEESISIMKQITSPLISKKFNTKYKNEELNKFKDEILSFLKERENYFFAKINSYQTHIDIEEKKYENLTKIIKLNYQEILSSQANINNRLDKLNAYEHFVSKTNDNLTSHEIRINNLREDFTKATHKYDKIYLDNLELPGYIGRCAKYKNCQSFFSDVIKELNKFNAFKEKQILDLKSYKEKLEQMIKTFKTLLDNNNDSQMKYISKLNDKNNIDYKNMVDALRDRVIELRLENSKYSVELINKTNEINEKINKIKELKSELLNEFYNKMDDFKLMNNNTIKSFNEFKNEYATIRKKFLELAEFIKDTRFRKNVGIESNKKEINNLYKNLIKKEKRSSKDNNVQLLDNLEEIEKMLFKVNSSNLNNNTNLNNNNSCNEKQLRGKKRHETYNSANNILTINYLGLNDNNNHKRDNKQNEDNNLSVKSYNNKIINFSENNGEKIELEIEEKVNNPTKKDMLLLISDNNSSKTNNNDNNNVINTLIKDRIKKRKLKINFNENNPKYPKLHQEKSFNIKPKDNIQEIINKEKKSPKNNEEKIENNNKNINEDEIKNLKTKEKNNLCLDTRKEINKDIKPEIINTDKIKNRRAQIKFGNKEKEKEKKQIGSSDTFSLSNSYSTFWNHNTMNTMLGTATISDKNISNISIPISYNINNVKCNKIILNDICREDNDNDNKIIKELASELEQTTSKKIKNIENYQNEIIKIEPVNLINNINKKEIIKAEDSKNIRCKSQSHEQIDLKDNTINSKEIMSDGEHSSKNIKISQLIKNNKLKSAISDFYNDDNININSDNNNISTKKDNKNELEYKNNDNVDYNYNYLIENNPELINKKLFIFSQKLFDIETYMKDKFMEIIKQIDSLRFANQKKFNNIHMNPFRKSGNRNEQNNIFNTINNDNNNNAFLNSNFSITGRDDNYLTNNNYHTIKSPKFEMNSQFYTSDNMKNLNFFKDSILIDNLKKNYKNEEISAIKKFIEKKIDLNGSKSLYKDFQKKGLKGINKNKNIFFYNSINGMDVNDNSNSRIKNKSTTTGYDLKWIDLKVLTNKKIPKNASCQKLNPILSGENKQII